MQSTFHFRVWQVYGMLIAIAIHVPQFRAMACGTLFASSISMPRMREWHMENLCDFLHSIFPNDLVHKACIVRLYVCRDLRRNRKTTMTNKMTVKTLLDQFNALRVARNESQIDSWKKSKQSLVDAIEQYVAQNAHVDDDDDNTMSIADLARELNMSPKIARAKLRRRGIRANDGHHVRFVRDDETFAKYLAIIQPMKTKTE